jgi:ABC-type multidrug transport system fused ATPase/permease subunit
MSFFDAQPAGRLLNRFSRDTEAADILLRENLAYWISEACAFPVNPRPSMVMLSLRYLQTGGQTVCLCGR